MFLTSYNIKNRHNGINIKTWFMVPSADFLNLLFVLITSLYL